VSDRKLTVAVTGPTGDVGRAAVRALEARPEVGRIIGMARRPFDPSEHGWTRTEYRQGDILERSSVDGLVAEADVVVHLAFIIFGDHDEAHQINLEGSRNVFEAARDAGAKRLVYTSSVAAYGFHDDNPELLTEDVPPRGSDGFYYSAHKAELESLLTETLAGSSTDAYVFRPCIVAGADALTLVTMMTSPAGLRTVVDPLRKALERLPVVRPVLPDPGVPLQLVHTEDVAKAIAAATTGEGPPGIYNLAAPDALTISDIARELGWVTVPIPRAAIGAAAAAIERAPLTPAIAEWVNTLRVPVLMDPTKAERELGIDWISGADTLAETVASARAQGEI
jgi:nucleoside-diphosphate-sugar epimerase